MIYEYILLLVTRKEIQSEIKLPTHELNTDTGFIANTISKNRRILLFTSTRELIYFPTHRHLTQLTSASGAPLELSAAALEMHRSLISPALHVRALRE